MSESALAVTNVSVTFISVVSVPAGASVSGSFVSWVLILVLYWPAVWYTIYYVAERVVAAIALGGDL